jgi:hypothetical protein
MYSVGGKIISVENKFREKRVNTLTFKVQGTQFPDNVLDINDGRNNVSFNSSEPNSVSVNWGDGVIETFEFGLEVLNAPYKIGWTSNGQATEDYNIIGDTLAGRHVYQDSNEGLRTITFTFRNLTKIRSVVFSFSKLYGQFPIEVGAALNLNVIELRSTLFLTEIPTTLSSIKNIETFIFNKTFLEKLEKIPDGVFENKVINLSATGSFDLSDSISSNFFKINNLSDTLQVLALEDCSIELLPRSLSECLLLFDLRITKNFIKNPQVLETLLNLERLYVNAGFFEDGLFETINLKKLRFFIIRNMSIDLINEIPLKWTGLKA